MLVEQISDRLPQRWTFPLILMPAIVVVLLTDVTSAVALASRVFAAYFLLQAFIAGRLAWRAKRWAWVTFFAGVCLDGGPLRVLHRAPALVGAAGAPA